MLYARQFTCKVCGSNKLFQVAQEHDVKYYECHECENVMEVYINTFNGKPILEREYKYVCAKS